MAAVGVPAFFAARVVAVAVDGVTRRRMRDRLLARCS